MDNVLLFSLIMVGSVFVSSCSQIILKKAAQKEYPNKIREYLNFPVIAAYGLFFLANLISIFSLKYVPLSMSPILESTGYIFINILSFLFLREKISRKTLIGMAVIIIGVVISSLKF